MRVEPSVHTTKVPNAVEADVLARFIMTGDDVLWVCRRVEEAVLVDFVSVSGKGW